MPLRVGIICEGTTDDVVLRAVVGAILGEEVIFYVKSWMSAGVPESAIIVLPRERTESWLLAASTNIKDVERVEQPEVRLPDGGSRGKREKTVPAHEALVGPLLPWLARAKNLRHVPELDRFIQKIRARARAVVKSTKASRRP